MFRELAVIEVEEYIVWYYSECCVVVYVDVVALLYLNSVFRPVR